MAQDTILSTDTVADALLTKVNDDIEELFETKSEVEAARDGETTLLAKEQAQDSAIAALSAASGVKVSDNDGAVGTLSTKIVLGDYLSYQISNPGGNETYDLSLDDTTMFETNLKKYFLL